MGDGVLIWYSYQTYYYSLIPPIDFRYTFPLRFGLIRVFSQNWKSDKGSSNPILHGLYSTFEPGRNPFISPLCLARFYCVVSSVSIIIWMLRVMRLLQNCDQMMTSKQQWRHTLSRLKLYIQSLSPILKWIMKSHPVSLGMMFHAYSTRL